MAIIRLTKDEYEFLKACKVQEIPAEIWQDADNIFALIIENIEKIEEKGE